MSNMMEPLKANMSLELMYIKTPVMKITLSLKETQAAKLLLPSSLIVPTTSPLLFTE
jgi:hypothetical protein